MTRVIHPNHLSHQPPDDEEDDDDLDEDNSDSDSQSANEDLHNSTHTWGSAGDHLLHHPNQQLMLPHEEDDDDQNVRHGFAEAYSSDEYLKALEASYFLYWTDSRHERAGLPKPPPTNPLERKIDWRNRDRVRTAAAVLVVCLRIGYDPPDVIKTDPCAKLECWIDPYATAKDKAMERIGKNLQTQFESLAATPKTRYKQFLDPPVEDAKKFCTAARKSAKNERVLFYYNGHGVPKPTTSGELWLFNKQYTQYIPVSLSEVVAWLGSPTIMVWDCSAAGNIVTKVQEFGIKRDQDLAKEAADAAAAAAASTSTSSANGSSSQPPPPSDAQQPPPPQIPSVPFRDTIQLGACLGHESLPMNPDLPADLFTCCLTSPIEIGLRFFLLRNPLKTNLTLNMLLEIPGKLNDRRTPLGELTWIFTAVTDTIAWNTLPRELFQKLFRHDLVVAALFRGFLLAERIMRFYDCTPISVPALPPTHNHPLWDSWDLAVDTCIAQLPALLTYVKTYRDVLPPSLTPNYDPSVPETPPPAPTILVTTPAQPPPPLPYTHSNFFAEQLMAFEIWLEQGGLGRRKQPEQLPVVLQVLLSQAHRLKALILLCKFLDLGPAAVNIALSIGIFAYVLRLLQAPAVELKPVLIYIWARILAVYESCKEDLLKQSYPPTRSLDQAPFIYFVTVLTGNNLPIPNVSEHRAMCAFILSVCCRDFRVGQSSCLRVGVFDACLVHVRDDDALLRQWSVLCIAQMWDDFDEAKGLGVRNRVHELFCGILHNDNVPEVRAAVLYALGTLLGTTGSSNKEKKFGRSIVCCGGASGLTPSEMTDVELGVAMATLKCSTDGNPAVRRELIVLLSSIVNEHRGQFVVAAYRTILERTARSSSTASESTTNGQGGVTEETLSFITTSLLAAAESDEGPSSPAFQATLFSCMYKTLFDLMTDPFPDIAVLAATVMDYILELLFASPLGPATRIALQNSPSSASYARVRPPPSAGTPVLELLPYPSSATVSALHTGANTPLTSNQPNGSTLASAMKNLANLATPAEPTPVPPTSLRLNGKSTGASSPKTSSSPGGLHSSASTDSLRYLQARAGKPASKSKATGAGIAGKEPTDQASIESIISALVASDEARLKRRRGLQSGAQAEEEKEQRLPLKGSFFDFALEYYKESQMRATEADEPGSVAHNQRVWRRARNESVIMKTQPMKAAACRSRWDEQIGFFQNEGIPNRILFHQFERHLVAADSKGNISVYDWEKNLRINRFANGTVPDVPISSIRFVNEDDMAMLMTGSADGHVRLFRKYESPRHVQLVSAFQGISDTLSTTTKQADAGLVLEWQQGRGHLLLGGNVKYIRVWDATREAALQDLPTRANSCLTSLTCDQVAGNILVGGFGDGGIKVYDRRIPPRDNMVRSYKGNHHAWIVNVHLQRGGNRELISGSLGGEVCLWDIRLTEPLRTFQAHQGGMSQMTVHEHAPIFATSSAYNVVKVWDMNGSPEPVSKFRNSFGYKTSPTSQTTISSGAMAFHPHHMILGCSAGTHINTFQIENYKGQLEKVTAQLSPLGVATRLATHTSPY